MRFFAASTLALRAALYPSCPRALAEVDKARDAEGSGTATADAAPIVVTVRLLCGPLEPGSHASHVHVGNCGGPIEVTLSDIQVREDGTAIPARTTFQELELADFYEACFVVDIHEGPSTDPGEAVICGFLEPAPEL
ncbi:MAG: hypothetical protein WEE64_06270 [Dehalococcoidia bacterium]